jgi:hypothetical protein
VLVAVAAKRMAWGGEGGGGCGGEWRGRSGVEGGKGEGFGVEGGKGEVPSGARRRW